MKNSSLIFSEAKNTEKTSQVNFCAHLLYRDKLGNQLLFSVTVPPNEITLGWYKGARIQMGDTKYLPDEKEFFESSIFNGSYNKFSDNNYFVIQKIENSYLKDVGLFWADPDFQAEVDYMIVTLEYNSGDRYAHIKYASGNSEAMVNIEEIHQYNYETREINSNFYKTLL